ncbi:MAG: hypothetical protein EPN89_19360, partial [Methylovulum sp.]
GATGPAGPTGATGATGATGPAGPNVSSVLTGGTRGNPFNGPLTYMGPGLGGGDLASAGKAEVPMPLGTARVLRVKLVTAPGAGASRKFTVLRGGAASPLTCTIAGTATTCVVSTAESQAFSDGDGLAIEHSASTVVAPTASEGSWSLLYAMP